MTKVAEAIIIATKQHHTRVNSHRLLCEESQDGYQKHGMFLMEMKDHEAALRSLCASEGLNFDDLKYDK